MSDCPCCEPPWSYLYTPTEEEEGDVIANPTSCLIRLADAAGRTSPWPTKLYVEDDFGHVFEFTWNGNEWIHPRFEEMTIQGTVNTCVGESRENRIFCYGNPPFNTINGLQFGSNSGALNTENPSFFIQAIGSGWRVQNGYSYDPIDITVTALIRLVEPPPSLAAICNPSDVNPFGTTRTIMRLFENT